MNLAVWIERNGLRFQDDPALAVGDATHATWAAFAARTAALAGGLRARLADGDRVAILMRNRPEYLEAMFATWHAGLVSVPVNARLHREEVAYILDHSGAAAVIVDEEHAHEVDATARTVIVAPGPDWDRLAAAAPIPIVDRVRDDAAWLFYTSGTTGRPKGATLTHGNLLMCALSYFADIDGVAPGDSILHAAPLSHGEIGRAHV